MSQPPAPSSAPSASSSWLASATVPEVVAGLDDHGYLADDGLATVVLLAVRMGRPLLLEGDPGVGKTEVAKVLSRWSGGELLRLQCFEGIDASQALYEWDHARQLLHVRAVEAAAVAGARTIEAGALDGELYHERFLVRRPLLAAISHDPAAGPPPVLLIDELDRADDEFEAFLLELLSDWSVTIPEIGVVQALVPPVVVITSNRTRDLHDALKRRCLYHWVDHPNPSRELAILLRRVPGLDSELAAEIAQAVAHLRTIGLYKPPGISETIDWATALSTLGMRSLADADVAATLGAVVKHREDLERVRTVDLSAVGVQ